MTTPSNGARIEVYSFRVSNRAFAASANRYGEFLHMPGAFTVQYWGMESLRESDPVWRPLSDFVTNDNYDGSGTDFGVRVVQVAGRGGGVLVLDQPAAVGAAIVEVEGHGDVADLGAAPGDQLAHEVQAVVVAAEDEHPIA